MEMKTPCHNANEMIYYMYCKEWLMFSTAPMLLVFRNEKKRNQLNIVQLLRKETTSVKFEIVVCIVNVKYQLLKNYRDN